MTLKRLIDYNVERRTLQIPAGQNPQTVECLVNPDPCCGVETKFCCQNVPATLCATLEYVPGTGAYDNSCVNSSFPITYDSGTDTWVGTTNVCSDTITLEFGNCRLLDPGAPCQDGVVDYGYVASTSSPLGFDSSIPASGCPCHGIYTYPLGSSVESYRVECSPFLFKGVIAIVNSGPYASAAIRVTITEDMTACGGSPSHQAYGGPLCPPITYPCNPAGPTRRRVVGLRVEKTIIPSLWLTKSDPTCTTNPFACCGGSDPGVTAGNGPVRGLTLEQTPLKTPAAGAYGSPSCSTPTNCCPPQPCSFASGIPNLLTATLHRNINIDVRNNGSCATDPTYGTHWGGYVEGGPIALYNIGGYKWRSGFNNFGSGVGNPGDFDLEGVNGNGGLYTPTNYSPWWSCTEQIGSPPASGPYPPGYHVSAFWVEVWYGDPPPLKSPGGNFICSFQQTDPYLVNTGYWMWDDVGQRSVLVPPPSGWWFGIHFITDTFSTTLGRSLNTPQIREPGFTMPVVYSMFRWPEPFATCCFMNNKSTTGGCPYIATGTSCGDILFPSGTHIFPSGGNDMFPCDPNYINCEPLFGSFGFDMKAPGAGTPWMHQNLLVGV